MNAKKIVESVRNLQEAKSNKTLFQIRDVSTGHFLTTEYRNTRFTEEGNVYSTLGKAQSAVKGFLRRQTTQWRGGHEYTAKDLEIVEFKMTERNTHAIAYSGPVPSDLDREWLQNNRTGLPK